MSLNCRRSTVFTKVSAVAALAAAGTLLASCSQHLAQVPRYDDLSPQMGEVTPKFMATAVSFNAIDETGVTNWPGSDEVVVSFADFHARKWANGGRFGDVDAGETRQFAADTRCMAPQTDCNLGSSSLQFGVIFFEEDGWVIPFLPVSFCPGTYVDTNAPPPTAEQFEAGFDSTEGNDCSGTVYISSDDVIGRTKVKLSRNELVALLPTVGASVDRTVRFSGAGGKYDFTYRLTRLADVGTPLVVNPGDDPVPPPPISLQAAVSTSNSGSRVGLRWSGATAATVDVYRNGAVTATTPNDGQHVEQPVASGMYQYRVCNTGSTTFCSADVVVVVP